MKRIIISIFLSASPICLGMTRVPQQKISQQVSNRINYYTRRLYSTYKLNQAAAVHVKILRKMTSQTKFLESARKRAQDKWYDPYIPAYLKKLRLTRAQRDINDATQHIERLKKENFDAFQKGLEQTKQLLEAKK